jgi:ParB family chromosome partitioning protein
VSAASASQVARHSSASIQHFTPTDIVERARGVMGGIDLDPASCALANGQLVKALQYYDERTNGFMIPWFGKVFLNPPGGRCDEHGNPVVKAWKGYAYPDGRPCAKAIPSTGAWWKKLIDEYYAGRIEQAVFIGFSIEVLQTTQSSSFPAMAFPICIPSKRIAFLTPDGDRCKTSGGPTHGNVIVYLPPRDEDEDEAFFRFDKAFASLGACKP